MTIAELSAITSANGLQLTDDQLKKLSRYAELLREKNQVVNLISRKDEENIPAKHILHSLCLALPNISLANIPPGANVFDLGTGGGLPGIPLKIARPDISLTVCDSIAKKIVATNEIIKGLSLDVLALTSRAEVLASQPRHKRKYDVVVTRAVAPLDELAGWSQLLLKPGGSILALKGGDLTEEKKKAEAMRSVKTVEETSLSLEGYDEFLKEEKKLVRVTMVW